MPIKEIKIGKDNYFANEKNEVFDANFNRVDDVVKHVVINIEKDNILFDPFLKVEDAQIPPPPNQLDDKLDIDNIKGLGFANVMWRNYDINKYYEYIGDHLDTKIDNVLSKLGYYNFIKQDNYTVDIRTSGEGLVLRVNYMNFKPLFFINEDSTLKSVNNKSKKELYTESISNNYEKIKYLCNVRIKSTEESGEIFGYKKVKRSMKDSGQLFKISEILPNYMCKKNGKAIDCISLIYKDKALKFVLDDIELIYPNVKNVLKGYNPPKDRTIKTNDHVKIIKTTKVFGITKGTKGKVVDFSSIGNVKYAKLDIENKSVFININKIKKIS